MRYSFNQKGSLYKGKKDGYIYNQAYAGNAAKVLFGRGIGIPSDLDPNNIISRGQNYNWRENFQIYPVLEWDTYFSQESVIGMQDMGSGDVGTFYTLRNIDSLPAVRTLPFEAEIQAVQSLGQDHKQKGLVLNAWYGVRFINLGSSQPLNGLLTLNIGIIYRFRLNGKDWKLQTPTAYYPGNVEEVDMNGPSRPGSNDE